MRRRPLTLLLLLPLSLPVTGSLAGLPAAYADQPQPDAAPHERVAQLEQEIADLRAENQRLRDEIATLQGQKRVLTELAGVSPEGQRVASAEARFKEQHDPATDRTTVRSERQRLATTRGTNADHFLTLAYTYAGETMTTRPDTVTLFIQSAFTGNAYQGADAAELLVNGEPLRVPVAAYEATPRQATIAGRRRVSQGDETVTLQLDPATLRRLASAVTVEGRLGATSFELNPEQIALFRAAQKRIEMGL